jgi:hypothetical protein
LLLRDAEVFHLRVGRYLQIEAGKDLTRPLHQRTAIDHAQGAAAHRLAPQEDVLRRAEVGSEVELLMDGADAERLGVVGMADTNLPAIDVNLARVRRVHAGHVHLARAHLQAHPVQRAHAGELLDDPAHREEHPLGAHGRFRLRASGCSPIRPRGRGWLRRSSRASRDARLKPRATSHDPGSDDADRL